MSLRTALTLSAATLLLMNCSSAGGQPEPPSPQDAGQQDEPMPEAAVPLDASSEESGIVVVPDASDAPVQLEEPPCDNDDPTGDLDGDGWSVQDGDCNDCTALMNPGAFDYPGGIDDDCNGIIDDEPESCDDGLPIEGNDAMDAARALGLCKVAVPDGQGVNRRWGVLGARYVFADGTTQSKDPKNWGSFCTGPGGLGSPPNALSRGILTQFGKNVQPRQGFAMVALSSGVARSGSWGDSPGGAHMCTRSGTAAGFPTPSTAACPNQNIDDSTVAYDSIALEVTIRTPSNAKSLSFDFDFYTYEYPDFVCSDYNDFFVTLLFPSAASKNNICFDAKGNPVSVNNGFLEACLPGTHGGKAFTCPLGTSELEGTGFEARGATGWLQTTAPVEPGSEVTLRFAIWDMGDDTYDSSVLLDNFKWEVEELPPQTVRPPK